MVYSFSSTLLYHACAEGGLNIRVIGIPKTMDNDLDITDHCPGFGSAARYAAQSACELALDASGLPIHVVVLELMGRNAGWVTAASALAARHRLRGTDLSAGGAGG